MAAVFRYALHKRLVLDLQVASSPYLTSNTLRRNVRLHSNFNVQQRYASTATTGTGNNNPVPDSAKLKIRDELDLSFNDARQAYRSKSTLEIMRAWVVFKLCSINALVENNEKVSVRHLYETTLVSYCSYPICS